MQLWIAEKPSVAKAICAELGIDKKGAGLTNAKAAILSLGASVTCWNRRAPMPIRLKMFPLPRKAEKYGVCRICRFSLQFGNST